MRKILLALILIIVTGCSQSLYMQGKQFADEGQYQRAIDLLYNEIKVNPENGKAWRELGVAFYRKNDLTKAEDALQQANAIQPMARSYLYLGLINESREDFPKAIESYRAALGLKPGSDIKDMVEDHLDRLISKNLEREVSYAITNEEKINPDTIPINTIAVVDFDNTYLSPELAPIAKGLAEFTAMDLAKVSSLKVVDRLKIDAILKELKLAQTGYVDPSQAPRAGRLMGSSQIVTGSLIGIGDDDLRLDGAVVNIRDSSTHTTGPLEGKVQKFFEIQKSFVFKVVNELGLTLSAEERDAIEEIPTESFLAFMAYCRGLDYQSKGMHREAKQEYSVAVKEDSRFGAAREKKEMASKAATAGNGQETSFEQFKADAIAASDEQQKSSGLDQFQSMNSDPTRFMRERRSHGTNFHFPPRVVVYGNIIIWGVLDAQF